MDESSTIVKTGAAILAWGTKDETWGLFEDLTVTEESNKEEILDGEGDTVAVIHHGLKTKVSLNFTPLAAGTGGPVPGASGFMTGSKLSIPDTAGKSVTIIIDSYETARKKAAPMTVKIEGCIYPKISVTA